jgi:hypothetical protein
VDVLAGLLELLLVQPCRSVGGDAPHVHGATDTRGGLLERIEHPDRSHDAVLPWDIIDGGMNARVDRHKLKSAAGGSGYETLVVWVQTDDMTSRQRSLKRNRQKLDDKYTAALTEEQFEAIAKRFTPPNQLEPTVVISGKHTYNTQARGVLKKLVAPREEAVKSIENPRNESPPNDPPPRRRLNVPIGS